MHLIIFTNKKRGGYAYFHIESPYNACVLEQGFMGEQLDFEGNVFDISMILDWKDIVSKTPLLFPMPPSSMGDLFGQVNKEDQIILVTLYQQKWNRVWMNTFYTTHMPTSF